MRMPDPISALLVLVLWPCALVAQERPGQAPEPSPRTHEVRRGDTLWDLAREYLRNPFRWPLIYEANRSSIRDPDLIYPRQRFVIPPLPDATAVAVKVPEEAPAPVAVASEPAVPEPAVPERTRFYAAVAAVPVEVGPGVEPVAAQPEAGRVSREEHEGAAWLADPGELVVVGRLVGRAGEREERSRLEHTAHPHDVVYLRRGGGEAPKPGDRLLLVRVGRSFGRWGRLIEPTAVVGVREVSGEAIVAEVRHQFGPVHPGNLAVPVEPFPAEGVGRRVEPVEGGPEGELLGFRLERPLPATPDQAFVSLGRAQGVGLGDELLVFRPARTVGGVRVPAEPVARLRVVRVAEGSATVRVTALAQPTLEPGLPVRLLAQAR